MEEIINIFEQQNYQECILKINAFLLKNDKNIDAYLLLAKCHYQLAVSEQENSENFYLQSFEYFTKVITIDPENIEALLYRTYLCVYNLVANKQAIALQDADVIIKTGNIESKIKGYNYQYMASCALSNSDLAISSLQKSKPLIEDFYKNNASEKAKSLATLELQMGDVFCYLKNDEPHAFTFYENGFNMYPFNYDFNKFLLGLTIKYQKFDTLGKVGNVLCDLINVENDHAFFAVIASETEKILNNGIQDLDIIKIHIRALHNDHDFDDLDLFTMVKKWAVQFPKESFFPEILGSILFYKNSYNEALPHFEKSLSINYKAKVQAKQIICNYYVNKKIEMVTIPKQFVAPLSSYSAGVDLDNLKHNFETDSANFLKICEIQKEFYQNAHYEFCNFFYNNSGNPLSNNEHYFAMNCNNYGIVLGELNQYEVSIPIFETGFQLSPFWQQLNSLAHAQYMSNKYQDCINSIDIMFTRYINYLPLEFYVYNNRILVDCYNQTNQQILAFQIIEKIENEKEFLEIEMFKLKDYTKIWGDLNIILNEKALLIQKNDSTENSILELQKRLATEPDNELIYFMLFQQYHQEKQYDKAVACADNYYQLVKNIDHDSQQTYSYRRGASLRRLNRMQESIADLENAVKLDQNDYWSKHELALSYFYDNQTPKFMPFASWCVKEYVKQDFNWDNEISELTFNLISVYKKENNKKEIMNLVKFILNKDTNNEEAKKLKKEFGGWFGF